MIYILNHVNSKLLSSHEDYMFVTISFSIFHILTWQDSLKMNKIQYQQKHLDTGICGRRQRQ